MKLPSEKAASRRKKRATFDPLSPYESELADFFVRMAGIIGVSPSVAEIYALLYASPKALSFDEIQGRLGISKGSVSQGLKFLRGHEMILSTKDKGSRREKWQPTPSLAASIVTLLRNQVVPALEFSAPSLERVLNQAETVHASPEVLERLRKLKHWNSRALELFPLLFPSAPKA